MSKNIDSLLDKIESEGFDYALVEYGDGIEDPTYQELRASYLAARETLADYLGVDS